MAKRGQTEPPTGPPQQDSLQATKLRLTPTESGLELQVDLNNRSGRTLHAVAEPRGIRYDQNTKTVQILMSDSELDDSKVGYASVIPRLVQVEPGATRSLRIGIPKQITRMVMSSGGAAPELETVPLTDAENIEVKIGWSATPLYMDPRERAKPVSPMKAWEEHVCVARERRSKG
jgi:hypothetical protein